MDQVFWAGIIIGAVLSLMASVVANLLNDRIQNWNEARLKKTSYRRKSKEMRIYRMVHGLKNGRLSQAYFFSFASATCLVYTLGTFGLSAASLASLEIQIAHGNFRNNITLGEMTTKETFWFSMSMALIFGSLVFSGLVIRLIMRIREIGGNLNSFTSYRRNLAARYPDFPFTRLESSAGTESAEHREQTETAATS